MSKYIFILSIIDADDEIETEEGGAARAGVPEKLNSTWRTAYGSVERMDLNFVVR